MIIEIVGSGKEDKNTCYIDWTWNEYEMEVKKIIRCTSVGECGIKKGVIEKRKISFWGTEQKTENKKVALQRTKPNVRG